MTKGEGAIAVSRRKADSKYSPPFCSLKHTHILTATHRHTPTSRPPLQCVQDECVRVCVRTVCLYILVDDHVHLPARVFSYPSAGHRRLKPTERQRPRPHKVDSLVKPHKSCVFRPNVRTELANPVPETTHFGTHPRRWFQIYPDLAVSC